MSNPSYCRFHNTLQDLRECRRDLDDDKKLSEDEAKAKECLVKLCCSIAEDYGDTLDEGNESD